MVMCAIYHLVEWCGLRPTASLPGRPHISDQGSQFGRPTFLKWYLVMTQRQLLDGDWNLNCLEIEGI
jgi:hypothetical protein